jgi:hypothetical protein
MGKKLDAASVMSEMREQAVHFRQSGPPAEDPPPGIPQTDKLKREDVPPEEKPASHRATTPPRHHATTVSWYHDTTIETVRKAVKQFGKEAATHRFTVEEKKLIADIIYAYRSSGIKTSENEIARIAVNILAEDYRQNGQNSVLDRVLRALNE